jgi:hypothetical protein
MTIVELGDIKLSILQLTSLNFPIWKVRISVKIRTLGASDILYSIESICAKHPYL